jgi:hypothetical protein
MNKEDVIKGQYVKHIKSGGVYWVVCLATHSETQEELVVYRKDKSGETWVRPLNMFIDGRFELI